MSRKEITNFGYCSIHEAIHYSVSCPLCEVDKEYLFPDSLDDEELKVIGEAFNRKKRGIAGDVSSVGGFESHPPHHKEEPLIFLFEKSR